MDGDILSLSRYNRYNLIDEYENETIARFLLWLTFCNVSVLAPLHYAEKRDRRWQYWYLLKMIIHSSWDGVAVEVLVGRRNAFLFVAGGYCCGAARCFVLAVSCY